PWLAANYWQSTADEGLQGVEVSLGAPRSSFDAKGQANGRVVA
ncbi:hypothetical protein THAOC_11622, partial [Thalassiosira oceanica]